jgi:hypothetical protein
MLTSGEPVPPDRSHVTIDPATGMQRGYIVLTPEERAKGFVKPVRRSYRHNTRTVCAKLQGADPLHRIGGTRHVCTLPQNHEGPCGAWRFVTQPEHAKLDHEHRMDCGGVTTMGTALAETYARDPHFYSGTFCARCKAHFPLAEFTWEPDGEPMHPPLQAAWAIEAANRHQAAADEAERNRLREISELEARLARLRARAPR